MAKLAGAHMEVNPQKRGAAGHQTPRLAIILIALLALIHVPRIAAFQLAQDAFAGHESAAWLYPALVDVFIGLTAPLVAFAIWRKTGLAVWVAALVWFTVSIVDIFNAVTTTLNMAVPFPHGLPFGSRSTFVTYLLVSAVVEGMAIVWLTRGKMRSHYFGSLGPGSQ
jgi:hypothetical protein